MVKAGEIRYFRDVLTGEPQRVKIIKPTEFRLMSKRWKEWVIEYLDGDLKGFTEAQKAKDLKKKKEVEGTVGI